MHAVEVSSRLSCVVRFGYQRRCRRNIPLFRPGASFLCWRSNKAHRFRCHQSATMTCAIAGHAAPSHFPGAPEAWRGDRTAPLSSSPDFGACTCLCRATGVVNLSPEKSLTRSDKAYLEPSHRLLLLYLISNVEVRASVFGDCSGRRFVRYADDSNIYVRSENVSLV
jgi:hypothetical protein